MNILLKCMNKRAIYVFLRHLPGIMALPLGIKALKVCAKSHISTYIVCQCPCAPNAVMLVWDSLSLSPGNFGTVDTEVVGRERNLDACLKVPLTE